SEASGTPPAATRRDGPTGSHGPRSLPRPLTVLSPAGRRIPARPCCAEAGPGAAREVCSGDRGRQVVHARPQRADEGQVAVELAVVQAVTHDVVVGDLEADIAHRRLDQPAERP